MVDYDLIGNKVIEFVSAYGMKVFTALAVLIIGWIAISIFSKILDKRFSKSKFIDPSLKHFFISLISVLLKALLVITTISMVGIQVTSFIAILGAAGLAIGLALQGSLSNFAGGVLILTLKPFEVGDFIEAQGHSGTVSEIHIFNTILKTADNKVVILPNGSVSNGNIINFTREKIRRVDMVFGIGYNDSIDKAKAVIENLIKNDKRIIKNDTDHAAKIVVSNLGDSSVDITVKVWTKTEDYWNVKFDMIENVKKEFDKKKISIPFPQRDIHMYKGK